MYSMFQSDVPTLAWETKIEDDLLLRRWYGSPLGANRLEEKKKKQITINHPCSTGFFFFWIWMVHS